MITPYDAPLRTNAGFLTLRGNLFDFGIMKTSVISEEFRQRYLSRSGRAGVFEARAIVFDGSDDYHHRINDPALEIDEHCILVIRGSGPIGWPGSAEVVNMQPPDALIQSRRPVLAHAGRWSAVRHIGQPVDTQRFTGERGRRRAGLAAHRRHHPHRSAMPAAATRWSSRRRSGAARAKCRRRSRPSNTPWEELYRAHTGQLVDGATLEFALKYRQISRKTPRHNH